MLCLGKPVSPVVLWNFLNRLSFHLEPTQFAALGQKAKYAKNKKGMSKNHQKEQWMQFRQNTKFAKKAKMANRTCNGCDKSSVKYGMMCMLLAKFCLLRETFTFTPYIKSTSAFEM